MATNRNVLTMKREISGFGGEYELACRRMLLAALDWIEAHPDAEPGFRAYGGAYGVLSEDNAAAQELSAAVLSACDDCTGAMHQAVVTSALWIRKHGLDAYLERMNRPADAAEASDG